MPFPQGTADKLDGSKDKFLSFIGFEAAALRGTVRHHEKLISNVDARVSVIETVHVPRISVVEACQSYMMVFLVGIFSWFAAFATFIMGSFHTISNKLSKVDRDTNKRCARIA